jgi:hypothetical protein
MADLPTADAAEATVAGYPDRSVWLPDGPFEIVGAS